MHLDPRDLIDRARAKDQNAMKELVKVREGALAGDPSARRAYDHLMQYARENPLGAHGEISDGVSSVINGEERHALGILRAADRNDPRVVMSALHHVHHPEAVRAACVALALQQPWTNPRIASFEGLLDEEPRRVVFREAVRVAPSQRRIHLIRQYIPRDQPAAIGSLCAGYCLGTARKFQLARLPSAPIGVIGAEIGWECGEDYDTNEEIQNLAHSMGVRD
jgi:hypothetical protein